jgi:hypothetical protein
VSTRNRISINDHAWIYREGGICTVFYSAIPIFRTYEGDRMGTHLAMVHLIETGLAKASVLPPANDGPILRRKTDPLIGF